VEICHNCAETSATFKTSTNTAKSTENKDEIILWIACFIEFGIVSVQFATGTRRLQCSAMHLAKQFSRAGDPATGVC